MLRLSLAFLTNPQNYQKVYTLVIVEEGRIFSVEACLA